MTLPNSQLQVPGDNPGFLVIPGSVASELQDLSGQVFHHCRHVDGCASSNPLRIVPLPESTRIRREKESILPAEPVDAANRELESCPAGVRLGLPLHLASLATARHLQVLKAVQSL